MNFIFFLTFIHRQLFLRAPTIRQTLVYFSGSYGVPGSGLLIDTYCVSDIGLLLGIYYVPGIILCSVPLLCTRHWSTD